MEVNVFIQTMSTGIRIVFHTFILNTKTSTKMAVDWTDVGLKSLTGVIVLGALIMYFSSSIFGLQVLNDNCKIELTTGDGGEDENAGWKESNG